MITVDGRTDEEISDDMEDLTPDELIALYVKATRIRELSWSLLYSVARPSVGDIFEKHRLNAIADMKARTLPEFVPGGVI